MEQGLVVVNRLNILPKKEHQRSEIFLSSDSKYMTKKNFAYAAVTGAMAATMIAATALPVFAETTSAMTSAKTQKTLDVACMAAAIDKRDTAISGAFDALKTAVTTRKDVLKSAWGQTDKKMRRDGIKAAWKAYASSVSSARSARKSAWTAFNTDRKACGTGAAAEDAATQAVDQNL